MRFIILRFDTYNRQKASNKTHTNRTKMYKFTAILAAIAASVTSASHLDNTTGAFDNWSYDEVKFKSRTNCSLDKYPEVSFLSI